ncbi:phosphoenolpyruvate synthase [Arthrobacter silvisoli]|uniref:phosphoenolpyruvate synthase n=1 Tax=Arthrobacter silvisoli TaxID=2291022 RepID=UPI000E2196C6|nr:phosphoenolpyruvate synthase [Arthrobacter silvisoli]
MNGVNVLWFDEIGSADVPHVGGKNASLGELTRALTAQGVRVPGGFATTADAFRRFIAGNRIGGQLDGAMEGYHSGRTSLREAGAAMRSAVLSAGLPNDLALDITEAYRELAHRADQSEPAVAVRSSATAEDLPDASFAGQQETFLNVRGEAAVLEACLRCYASLFTDRAISYRDLMGFSQQDVALSVGIQLMVRSDRGSAGVMFSLDPSTGFPRAAVISANWGLGETVVQGSVNPDKYMVFTPLLGPGKHPVIERTKGSKIRKLVHGPGGAGTALVDTSDAERGAFVLDEEDILILAGWAVKIENHYGKAMDIEWAKDGVSGELFIVQARPETVQSRRTAASFTTYRLKKAGVVLASGAAVGNGMASSVACLITDPSRIDQFVDGSVLVTAQTDPDWVPVMKRAAAIVTDRGGVTSHAAIVSRELGINAVVGTGEATMRIADGQPVTVDCADGDRGVVYEGSLPFEAIEHGVGDVPATRTKLMVNLADPGGAFRWWKLPAQGVGLARMEFVINEMVRVHPMALIHPDRVPDPAERETIAALTGDFPSPADYFVETLATGLAKLAAVFYPHPAIVRLSDFKSNEYRRLIGGSAFEGVEENPMLGLRGASRYYHPRYQAGFELECRAIKRLRDYHGFDNVVVMVPFCRTPGEAAQVLEVMASNGLVRGQNGLKVYMMCEVPSNVILAERFAAAFDGFSIGSNDLTQLVLGADRDSAELAALFDERDEAVEVMIGDAIRKAHNAGIPVGLCGQAPSNHPDFAEFLVGHGIDSISLNPDTFVRTAAVVAGAETAGGPEAR